MTNINEIQDNAENTIMPEEVVKPVWALANGKPKPEWKLVLKAPLSDGSKELFLMEPTVKSIRRATKLLEFEPSSDANGDRVPKQESVLAYGIALIAGVTNLTDEVIEEIPMSLFTAVVEYLGSFTQAR
jgi:hypothetical protein